jgi:hypothetical protein
MFYFTHLEMIYFLVGQNISPVVIYGLSWFKLNSGSSVFLKELITPELYHFGSAGIYFLMFFLTHKYISFYIYREDDLTGQTDAIRRMVRDSFQGDPFDVVVDILKKLLFPSSLLILNLGITPLATKLVTIIQPNYVQNSEFFHYWVCRVCIIPGVYFGKYWILRSLGWISILTILRLLILCIMVVDNFFQLGLLTNHLVYWPTYITFYCSLGYCLINVYAQSAARNEDWKRKKVGFIMFLSTVVGLAYGDILGVTAINTKLVEA